MDPNLLVIKKRTALHIVIHKKSTPSPDTCVAKHADQSDYIYRVTDD